MRRSFILFVSSLFIVFQTVTGVANARTIAGIIFHTDNFMETVKAGIGAAAEDAGVNVVFGNSEDDLVKEADAIDNFIASGVDAIAITTISADGSVAAIKRAIDAGIKIVCWNTCLNENSRDGISSFLLTENIDLGIKTGKFAAQWIKENMKGEQVVLGLLNCDAFPEACIPRKNGFLQELDAAEIDYVIADDQEGWLVDKAMVVTEAMLQAHPNINVMWSANELGTVGIVNVVKAGGYSDQISVFGTDISVELARFLTEENGVLKAVTGQAPFQIGYDSLNAALDALDGKAVEAVQIVPTTLFAYDDPDTIASFVETGGKALF